MPIVLALLAPALCDDKVCGRFIQLVHLIACQDVCSLNQFSKTVQGEFGLNEQCEPVEVTE